MVECAGECKSKCTSPAGRWSAAGCCLSRGVFERDAQCDLEDPLDAEVVDAALRGLDPPQCGRVLASPRMEIVTTAAERKRSRQPSTTKRAVHMVERRKRRLGEPLTVARDSVMQLTQEVVDRLISSKMSTPRR